jgi:threonyl-tRNA synthetase
MQICRYADMHICGYPNVLILENTEVRKRALPLPIAHSPPSPMSQPQAPAKSTKLNATSKFAVLDLASLKGKETILLANMKKMKFIIANYSSFYIIVDHVNTAKDGSKREQTRANKASGDRIAGSGHIGGNFQVSLNPTYLAQRSAVFERLWRNYQDTLAARPDQAISVTLPSGDVKEGVAFKIIACDEDDEASASKAQAETVSEGELWDMNRPLIGDCKLQLLKFDDPEGKTVFWHSSAHVLGAAIEGVYGAHLTIGPPLTNGFYYDSFMGEHTVPDEDLKKIESKAMEVCKAKHSFQRLVVSKEEALEMFASNPFKVSLIQNKIPEGSKTTVYRCGPLIDLCMGPHLPNTGKIKAFAAVKTSSANWLGDVNNDPLQRIYGIAFPDKALLKKWQEFQEQAKQRDHRLVGNKQELFFFHQLSPGSCFWLPHGARVYNKLIEFIRNQYWSRGYQEVITPNIFNLQLWEISGHAQHYKENMFTFDVENQEWGMKPMNCPAHCLLFAHRLRSYRELPLRVADFGVLHRNEVSGALTGLTRVRRFQQDDAHIFCRQDQIKSEVLGALDFMRFVYGVFGMTYKLELSTRPAKALGEVELWNRAESQLAEALDEFAGPGQWKVNPGDGAFYGPKIDIKVFDALERVHQCATVQLDFQLPIRFGLEYKSNTADGGEDSFQRPVMVHRAMLGSVERMAAVLTEHFGGKWPFWLSPRQCVVIPVDLKFVEYAYDVQQLIHEAGFYVDVDDSTRTLNKKVREAEVNQYNFILVVGQQEIDSKGVNVRTRENEVQGNVPVVELIQKFKDLTANFK